MCGYLPIQFIEWSFSHTILLSIHNILLVSSIMLPIGEDLLSVHILSRLRAKSLFRCRSVCKSWRCLIDDPAFPKLHLDRSIADGQNSTSVLYQDQIGNMASLDGEEAFISTSAENLLALAPPPLGHIDNSCNGLICLSYGDHRNLVYLWNPTTGEHAELPHAPSFAGEENYSATIGLGCNADCNQYKVLSLVGLFHKEYPHNYIKSQVRVHTLGSDSWRILDCDVPPAHKNQWLDRISKLVNFHGRLYWILSNHNDTKFRLVWFDVEKEQFQEIAAPGLSFDRHSEFLLGVEVINGRLSIYYSYRNHPSINWNTHLEIWTIQDGDWSRVFYIRDPFYILKPLMIFKDGESLLHREQDGQLFVYNGTSKFLPGLPRNHRVKGYFRMQIAYVETLVSIAYLMSSQESKRPTKRRCLGLA